MKRQWRVGTWSMGAALTGMGVLLLLSRFDGSAWLEQGLIWWPVMLILIGLEILIYLWQSKTEHPVLRYDVFSILFIGLLGVGCLLLTTASASGLVEEVRSTVGAREVRIAAEPFAVKADDGVKRIVLQGEYGFNGYVGVDPVNGAGEDARMMGACRYELGSGEKAPSSLRLAEAQQAGDTLYVNIVSPPDAGGLLHRSSPICQVTLLLPAEKKVEVIGGTVHASLLNGRSQPKSWEWVKP